MRLFGYTDDKDLVEIDIPIGEIVAYEIDPWRLDLFDPDPVVYQAGEKTINFRRLNNLAFIYNADGKAVLGLHDGAHQACVWTEDCLTLSSGDVNWHKVISNDIRMNPQGRGGARWLGTAHAFRQMRAESHLTDVRTTNRSYAHHLHQYLSALDQEGQTGSIPSSPRSQAHHLHQHLSALDQADQTGSSPSSPRAPHTADRVTMRGTTFVFRQDPPSLELNPFINFEGQMFAERAVPYKTPPAVQWALHEFRLLQPMIVGKAILNALLNREVTEVEILLQSKTWPEQLKGMGLQLSDRISNSRLLDVPQEFIDHDGCQFAIGCKRPDQTPAAWLRNGDIRFSVDGLYCERVGEVRGTRLAFFDIGNGCTRAVSQSALAHSYGLRDGSNHPSGIVLPVEQADTRDERLFQDAVTQFADLQLRVVRRATLLSSL